MNWVDRLKGSKTVIGTLLIAVAPYVPNPAASQIVALLGGLLAGVGVVHKVVNVAQGKNATTGTMEVPKSEG